jgi:predicted Zn-dependent protease
VAKDLTTAAIGIDENEEIAIGRELAGRTLGAARLVNDPALQAYVNRVGRWIASQSERAELPWRFGVIDTASVNAFAAPGGFILVTRGLYDLLENESQLAGVLGHEIGHVVRRHHVSVLQKSAAVSAGAKIAQRDNRGAFVNALIGNGAEVFTRALDKDAEFEADALGVVLAVRAGYSAQGLMDVLARLQSRSGSDDTMKLLFATHPAPGERLQRVTDAVAPRAASLPEGKAPALRTVSASAGPASTSAAAAPRGTRAMQEEPAAPREPAPSASAPASKGGSDLPVDPATLLRGIFGR